MVPRSSSYGRGLAVVVLVIAAFAGASLTESASAASAVCTATSGTITTTDGHPHSWYSHIAPGGAPAGGRPVLIYLHGDGGNGVGRAPEWWSSSDPDGGIIITPSSEDWTWYRSTGDIAGRPLDAQFIATLLKELATNCAGVVNPQEIFVGGISAGGFMAYNVLARHDVANLISAVAVDAGQGWCQAVGEGFSDPQCPFQLGAVAPTSGARIIHVHGTSDAEVPPPLATAVSGQYYTFYPMARWAAHAGCYDESRPASSAPGDNGVVRETYGIGPRTARVYDLTGGGHSTGCSKYQLILVEGSPHEAHGQESREWAFLMNRSFSGIQGQITNATVAISSVPRHIRRGRVLVVVGAANVDGVSLSLICARGHRTAKVLASSTAFDGGFQLSHRMRRRGTFHCVVSIPPAASSTAASSSGFTVRVR